MRSARYDDGLCKSQLLYTEGHTTPSADGEGRRACVTFIVTVTNSNLKSSNNLEANTCTYTLFLKNAKANQNALHSQALLARSYL